MSERYVIEYPNGGMGNSLLSHILYSCRKIDINLEDLFNQDGNAHNIGKLNNTNLLAKHYQYMSDQDSCIFELIPNSLYNLLRLKFSYAKWYKDYPTADNFLNFGFLITNEKSYDEYLESLTLKYYTIFNDSQIKKFKDSKLISLESFIKNDVDIVKNDIQEKLNWEWDDTRSLEFYKTMIYYNTTYLNWFEQIQKFYFDTCNLLVRECDLEFWEQAAIIALYCLENDIDPNKLNWYNNCFFEQNNLYFIKEMENKK